MREGLEAARRRSDRLCLHGEDRVPRAVRLWEGRLAAADVGPTRGPMPPCDGPRRLASCLVVAVPGDGAPGGERAYGLKAWAAITDTLPLDSERAEPAPVAPIPASPGRGLASRLRRPRPKT